MKYDTVAQLQKIGISYDHAVALRRISMTLRRWHEMECGDSNDFSSWVIVRGRKTPRTFKRDPESQRPIWEGGEFIHDDAGKPFVEHHSHNSSGVTYRPIADRETGAKNRLAKIMASYPTLSTYIQGDPRGAALYILRPGDVPEGCEVDSYYSRGVVVCQ